MVDQLHQHAGQRLTKMPAAGHSNASCRLNWSKKIPIERLCHALAAINGCHGDFLRRRGIPRVFSIVQRRQQAFLSSNQLERLGSSTDFYFNQPLLRNGLRSIQPQKMPLMLSGMLICAVQLTLVMIAGHSHIDVTDHVEVVVVDVDDFDRILVLECVGNWPADNFSLSKVDRALVVDVV